jgi:GNAT superfamily N-acetyltransferase
VSAGAVRPARERELDRLAALFTALLEHHAELGPAFVPGAGACDTIRELLRTRIADADRCILVFERGDDLAGLCAAAVLRRPPLFAETARGEIEHLFVREDARRQGVGRALAEAAAAWLRERGIGRVEVAVARANDAGSAFWHALGFRPAMDVLERGL